MQFRQVSYIGDEPLIITLSSDIESHGNLFKIGGTGSLSSTYEGLGVRLSGSDDWLINPAFIRTTAEIEIFGENTSSPIRLSARQKTVNSQTGDETEIHFPSLSLLKAARICAETSISRIPNQITELADDEANAVWRFLERISDVVSYNNYLSMIESLSEISPAFRFELIQQVEEQIQQMLVGWESNAEFRIESYSDFESRIDDFEELSTIQKLPQSIDKKEVLMSALADVESRGTLQDIVDLCQALNLPKHQPELIRYHQARAIIADRLIEDHLDEAWNVSRNCLNLDHPEHNGSYDKVASTAMDESNLSNKADHWGAAILAASGNYQTRTAISNYLYWSARDTNGHPRACARLFEAAYNGFLRSEISHMAQHSKYNHYAQLGYAHRQEKEYDLASDHFLQAYVVADNATQEFDRRQLSQCIIATRNWATACADHYRYQGKYSLGIHVLETAKQSIELLNDEYNDEIDKNNLDKLRAERRVLEMERYLTQAKYELALETAGNVIGIYAELDNQESQNWAITKRREIQAIVYETNGELTRAANLHRDIGETGAISDSRQRWHIHRGDICEAKQLALEGEYEQAKTQLLEIQTRANQLESEANDLSIVLDAVIDYQQGQQNTFQTSVQQLSQPNDQHQRVPPMSVEYDYKEPLSVIHAAQSLNSYNVDEELLSMAVEVALQASLIPLNSGEAAATVGIDEVDLRDQWVNQLPAPVAQRIKQIELDMAVPQTDYVGLGSRLFSLVELYLAIFSEYFGTQKWGTEWRPNLSDAGKTKNMSLGDLANVFKRCAEQISSSDVANDLVSGEGQTPSVTKLRNDIGHIKTDDVDKTQFNRFYDRVMNIFRVTADDVPAIGKKIETRGEGAFQRDLVQLQWWRSIRLVYVQTNAELTDGDLYYFPQEPIAKTGDQGSVTVSADEIVPVSTDRIADKL